MYNVDEGDTGGKYLNVDDREESIDEGMFFFSGGVLKALKFSLLEAQK